MEILKKRRRRKHLARKRNKLQLHYDLNAPYYPEKYGYVGPTNRHLYKKIRRAYIKEHILVVDWKRVWADIGNTNTRQDN